MENVLLYKNILNEEYKLTDKGWILLKRMDKDAVCGLMISMEREINNQVLFGLNVSGFSASLSSYEAEELKDRIICRMIETYRCDFDIERYLL